VEAAGFAEVCGLETDTDVIEYRNGNEDLTVRKIPGLRKFTNITLKRGITTSLELWQWRRTVMDGQIERRSGAVILLDESRQPVRRFEFREAWPCRWEGPALRAKGNEVAIETLEICHEGLDVE
jgi:phage tail-like protein